MRRLVLAGAVLVLTVFIIGPASATPGTVTQAPTAVSGASPLTGLPCSTQTGGPDGVVFPDSEVEPWVDVSPANPNVVATIWQQDRWSNGGSRDNVGAVSFNGGATWDTFKFPGITQCTGGPFQRNTDPWLSFSPNGDLYVMHLGLDITPPPGRPGGFGANAMIVQKIPASAFADNDIAESEISAPITLVREDNGDLHDKNSLTADPTDSNFAYAVWDRLDIPQGAVIRPEERPFINGFRGTALFSRTTNGGQSWERPSVLYDPGGNAQTIGNQIVVDPNTGVLHDFFAEILFFRNDEGGLQFNDMNVSMKLSRDKGKTWGGRVERIAKLQRTTIRDPDTGQAHRTGDIIVDAAVDPTTGDLYVVWQDRRFTGRSSVALSRSTDGGASWSAPIRVNQTPITGNRNDQAWTPSVHVTSNGVVGVSYYDFRNNVLGVGGTDTDHWLVHCHSSCGSASGWVAANETRVTAASFDARQAPVTGVRGFFLGDYVGLDSFGSTFTPFYTEGVAAPANPTDEFYAELTQ